MYKTDSYNLQIPRGDTASVPFKFLYEDTREPFLLQPGQYAVLSVYMDRNKPPVITKRAEQVDQDVDGVLFFNFLATDTDITRYRYSYNVRLYNDDGSEIDMWHGFPDRATFEIG